jgi:hypothetical protein
MVSGLEMPIGVKHDVYGHKEQERTNVTVCLCVCVSVSLGMVQSTP